MNETISQPTDQDALTLTHAIALQESGGGSNKPNYNAVGDAGTSHGAYQWQPGNFEAAAKKYGLDPNDKSPMNQDKVAYKQVKEMKDKGLDPGQIASTWNSGSPNNWKDHSGTTVINGQAIKYDTPAYVRNVQKYYTQLKGQQPAPQAPQSSQGQTQGQPQDPNAPDTYGATFKASPTDNPLVAGAKALGNVPSSLANLGSGLLNAAVHPIKTVEGLGNAFAGGIEQGFNAITGGQQPDNQQTQTFNALKKSLYDRYGSLENAQRTATNDPAGFGADVLSILEGGTAGLDKLAGTATNETLNTGLSTLAKPIVSGIKSVASAPFSLVGKTLGLQTGTSGDTVAEGLNASAEGGQANKSFLEGLRGNSSPEDLVNQARSAVNEVQTNGSNAYKQMLSGIKASPGSYDISPIIENVDKKLADFGIVKNADGTLDFSRSTIGEGADATKIQQIYDDVNNWGSRSGDRTAAGLDTLKRRIGNYYSPNSDIRAFVTSARQATKDVLSNVPGYTQGMSDYSDMLDNVTDISKGLSLGDNAMVETTYKKLISALKQNNEFRKQLVLELNKTTSGAGLLPKIAGQQLSSTLPRGLMSQFEGGLMGTTAVFANQALLPLLAWSITTSPRIVGEFIHALGLGIRGTNALMSLLDKIAKPAVLGGNALNRAIGK